MAISICNVSPILYCPFYSARGTDRRFFSVPPSASASVKMHPMAQYGTNYKQNIKFWQCLLYIYAKNFSEAVIVHSNLNAKRAAPLRDCPFISLYRLLLPITLHNRSDSGSAISRNPRTSPQGRALQPSEARSSLLLHRSSK